MAQQCVLVGAIVGSLVGCLVLALIGLVAYLHCRSYQLAEAAKRNDMLAEAAKRDAMLAVERQRQRQLQLTREPTPPTPEHSGRNPPRGFPDRPFYLYGLLPRKIFKWAEDLNDMVRVTSLDFIPGPMPSLDTTRMINLIKAFGPVIGQEPPEKLADLIKSEKSRDRAMEHIISTTLVSSIMLESKHVQLLAPSVADFHRYCRTPDTMSRLPFERDAAKVRQVIRSILPYPDVEPAKLKIETYLMEVFDPLLADKPTFRKYLYRTMDCFSEFGNSLMLEPTSWEWDFTHRCAPQEEYILYFPGFRQVRDAEGDLRESLLKFDTQACKLDPDDGQ